MTDLALSYVQVGRTAREWDEQHVDLTGASVQVAEATLAGFSPRVRLAALLFRFRWAEHVGVLGQESEVRADGLRDALREYVDSDQSSLMSSALVLKLLEEVR